MSVDTIPSDLILENVNDAIIVLNPSGHILTWNAAAERIYGWKTEDVLGKPLTDVIPVVRYLDGSAPEQVLATLNEQGLWQGVVLQPHHDGHVLTIGSSVRLLRSPDGTARSLIAINRDLSVQAHLDAQLQVSEARFQAQYQGFPIPTMTWQAVGGDFVLIDVNRAALDFTQGRIQAFVGRQASVVYRDDPQAFADFARCYAEQTIIQHELWRTLVTNGEQRFVAVSYAPVPPDIVMLHLVDLTARKRAEEALTQEYHRLQHILDIAPVAMAVFDRTMHFVAHSRKWIELYGPPGQILIGRQLQDFVPIFPGNWTETIARALAGETISRREETWEDPTAEATQSGP